MKTYLILFNINSITHTKRIDAIDLIDAIHIAVYQENISRSTITEITEIKN